jgi:hypothetical protein
VRFHRVAGPVVEVADVRVVKVDHLLLGTHLSRSEKSLSVLVLIFFNGLLFAQNG